MHQFPQSQELLPQHGLSKTGFAMLFPVPASLTHLIVDVYNRCCIKIGFNNLLSLDSFVKYFRLSYLLPIFTFLPIPWTSSTTPSSSFVADSLPNLCFAGFFPRTLIALHDTRLPTENGIIVARRCAKLTTAADAFYMYVKLNRNCPVRLKVQCNPYPIHKVQAS